MDKIAFLLYNSEQIKLCLTSKNFDMRKRYKLWAIATVLALVGMVFYFYKNEIKKTTEVVAHNQEQTIGESSLNNFQKFGTVTTKKGILIPDSVNGKRVTELFFGCTFDNATLKGVPYSTSAKVVNLSMPADTMLWTAHTKRDFLLTYNPVNYRSWGKEELKVVATSKDQIKEIQIFIKLN